MIGHHRFCKYVCSLEFDLSNFSKVIMILAESRMLLIFDVVVWSLSCIDIYISYNVFQCCGRNSFYCSIYGSFIIASFYKCVITIEILDTEALFTSVVMILPF